jgi:signal transduction histidine kinase
MILNPVDRLVAASRELAAERFEHRVPLDRDDEFDELASAYNDLAQRLQANERKRLETLGMVALTLNHELNNAMGMIELQLQLVARRVGQREPVERSLRRIAEGLARMSRTVESLKHIKRIVLTDYVEGTKMLDLEKSTQQHYEPPQLCAASATTRDYSI